MTTRRSIRAASAAGVRSRTQHSLAPGHLGDAVAAAVVAVIVGGIAFVITGVGMIAMALTLGSRYGSDPPPNLGSLALLPIGLGLLLLLLGGGLAAGGVAVLGDVRRSRPVTGALSAVAAVASLVGAVLTATSAPPDPVLAIASAVAAVVFGAAAFLLLRPRP